MTFAAYETADGSPIELLQFVNGSQVFHYTNAVSQVVLGATTYLPLAYRRTKFSQSKDSDDNNITMTAPRDIPIAALFNGILTSNITTCTIQRLHRDDGDEQLQILWKGRIVALNRKGAVVDILLQPLSHGGESTPRDVFSSLCNSMLFDTPGCSLLRDNWKFVGTITSLSVDGLEVTVNGLRTQAGILDTAQGGPTGPLSAAELDTFWQGGFMILGNGEVRDIVEGDIGSDPDKVRLDIPFRSVAASDGCTVYAGCILNRQICHKKFNNVINFQGYPDIPEVDPANTELPPGSRDTASKFTS